MPLPALQDITATRLAEDGSADPIKGVIRIETSPREKATYSADHRGARIPTDAAARARREKHCVTCEFRLPAVNGESVVPGVRRHRFAGAVICRRRGPHHRR